MRLSWSEMAWWYIPDPQSWSRQMVAELSRRPYPTLMRVGDEVLIDSPENRPRLSIIPAAAVISGWECTGDPRLANGTPLAQIMEEGVIYDYLFRPVG